MGMSTTNPKPIGLVIPTRFEATDILNRWTFRRHDGIYEGVIADRMILICISGVGREAARQAGYRLVAAGAGELVSVGFCGALVGDLKVGDLVTDRMISSDTPAATRAQREALKLKANAIAVDMETQAIIEAGTRKGVPIRILRVVSDRLEDDLSPLLGTGAFSIPKIALRLLNPAVWPLAALLRRHSAIARRRLAEALEELVRQPTAQS